MAAKIFQGWYPFFADFQRVGGQQSADGGWSKIGSDGWGIPPVSPPAPMYAMDI